MGGSFGGVSQPIPKGFYFKLYAARQVTKMWPWGSPLQLRFDAPAIRFTVTSSCNDRYLGINGRSRSPFTSLGLVPNHLEAVV